MGDVVEKNVNKTAVGMFMVSKLVRIFAHNKTKVLYYGLLSCN